MKSLVARVNADDPWAPITTEEIVTMGLDGPLDSLAAFLEDHALCTLAVPQSVVLEPPMWLGDAGRVGVRALCTCCGVEDVVSTDATPATDGLRNWWYTLLVRVIAAYPDVFVGGDGRVSSPEFRRCVNAIEEAMRLCVLKDDDGSAAVVH